MKKELFLMTAALAILACSQEKPELGETDQPQTKVSYLSGVEPTEQVGFDPGGSSVVYTVSATPETFWTVDFNVPWIHATPSSGRGSGTFTCTTDSCNTVYPGRTGMMTVSNTSGLYEKFQRPFYQMCMDYPKPDNFLTEHVNGNSIYVTSAYPVTSDLRIKLYGASYQSGKINFYFGEVTMASGSQQSTQAYGNYDRVLTVWPYYDASYHYRHR